MTSMILPAVVLMLVTAVVWLKMFIGRLVATKKLGIEPQDLATPEQVTAAFNDRTQAAGNCFKNLFEMPVIFYALTAFITTLGIPDTLYVNLAWTFVGLRGLQASVHCTYNKVMHRFLAYFASSLVLWFMLIRVFMTLI